MELLKSEKTHMGRSNPMKRIAVFAASLLALLAPTEGLAHHSFAMFDPTKEVEVTGIVVEWQWTSPHTWLYLLVPGGGKEPDKYSIEGGNPGVLRRDGFEKESIKRGDRVTVYMQPLRSGERGGAINAVLLPNGKLLGKRLEAVK